jgi:2'-5' RNA ligase
MDTRETALVVPVPAAEPVVGPWRQQHDPVAAQGVPAHVTLLYPFRSPNDITGAVLRELASIFAAMAPFPFSLSRVATFPTVAYLTPEPAAPFVQLIEQLMQRYPDAPPYGGAFRTITPHLTVIQTSEPEQLTGLVQAFRRAMGGVLPVLASAVEAWLLEQRADNSWHVHRRFPFAGSCQVPNA